MQTDNFSMGRPCEALAGIKVKGRGEEDEEEGIREQTIMKENNDFARLQFYKTNKQNGFVSY